MTPHQATQRSTQPASKQQFIEIGDAICGIHQSRREDLESQARELRPLSAVANAMVAAAMAGWVATLFAEGSRKLREAASEIANRKPPDAAEVSPVLSDFPPRAWSI